MLNNKFLCNKKNFKKGQVTMFVIVALVLAIIIALALFMKSSTMKVRPPVENLEVSEDAKPIQDYITTCLSSISKEALIKVGNSGGRTSLTGLRINALPYKSEALIFQPNVMPYWYYLDKTCKDTPYGCLKLDPPALCNLQDECIIESNGQRSIEGAVSDYVKQKISGCINSVDSFKEIYDIKFGSIDVDTRVLDTSVGIRLDMPTEITKKGSTKSIKIPYYYVTHKVKLKQIYELSKDIVESEANYTFLESLTMDLITIYSGIDSKLLPPIAGMEMFTSGKKYWIRSQVKKQLMDDVLPYMSMIQILNTGNAKSIYTPDITDPDYISFSQGIYKRFLVKVSNTTYSDLNARIEYPYSDIYLKVGNGELIKPTGLDAGDNVLLKMMNFAMNDYSFSYDISYPVIVKITDPEAFNGEGYTFNYAIEANIRNNIAVNQSMAALVVDVRTLRNVDFNSEEQQSQRPIKIKTIDRHTGKALENVTIFYTCGQQFEIGITTLSDSEASWIGKLPFCPVGGQLTFEKQGYMSGGIDFNNPEGTDSEDVEYKMWPLVEKKIKVYKRTPSNINTIANAGAGSIVLFSTQYSNITKNESVILNVARIKETPQDGDVPLVGFLMYKSKNSTQNIISKTKQREKILKLYTDGNINSTLKDSMLADLELYNESGLSDIGTISNDTYILDFVPGEYKMDAMMLFNGAVYIPAESREVCAVDLGIVSIGCEDINLEAQTFDTWINGGSVLTFRLTENDVYSNKNTLVFYVLEMPLPKTWNDLENYQSPEDYQAGKSYLVKQEMRRE